MASRANYSAQALANPGLISSRNAQVKAARGLGIKAPGLSKLRRDFKRLAPEVDLALKGELLIVARPVLERGKQLTPQGGPNPGKLMRSERISVANRGVSIGSRLPYAAVIHWGGSTGKGHRPGVPWSGSVLVKPSLFRSRALEEHEPEIMVGMGAAVERAAVRTGWRAGVAP